MNEMTRVKPSGAQTPPTPPTATISMDRKTAISGLKAALRVIERRNTIPVLDAVRVVPAPGAGASPDCGQVAFYATNMDETIAVTLPADVQPAKRTKGDREFYIGDPAGLVAALSAAGGSSVEIGATDAGYVARAGAVQREGSQQYCDDEWPGAHAFVVKPALEMTFGPAVLKRIALLRCAIRNEETRYYLNGIFMHRLDEWTWRFVATDGHRLITVDVPVPGATGEMPPIFPQNIREQNGVILPPSWIRPVLDLFMRGDAPVTLTIGWTQRQLDQIAAHEAAPPDEDGTKKPFNLWPALMMSGQMAARDGLQIDLAGKPIDGTYPDYSRVIPTKFIGQALMRVRDLRQAILAVAAGAGPRSMPAMKISFGDEGAELQVNLVDQSIRSSCTVDCEHTTPGGFAIGFKPSYLIDLLAIFAGEEVLLRFTDSLGPCVISDPADPELTAVLMPMRFS